MSSAATASSKFVLPDLRTGLTEATSLALAEQIQVHPISTPLCPPAIATSYVRQGEGGTPILLLHGFDSSVFEYRRLLPLLATQQSVWAVDLLGFGFTERPQGVKFSAMALKTHLYYFRKTLIAQPVILVGASMGGAAALEFALSYPEAVQQLVLIDSAGLQPGPPGQFLVPPLGFLATEFLRSPRVRRQISRNAYHDPSFASLDAQACAALHLKVPGWRQALITFTQSGGYGSLESQLASLQIPTLILWGESDRILGTADAPRLQRAIANSQLIWIPEAGHVPHLERPQLVADHLLSWQPGQTSVSR